jgi:hypothetical protein
VPKLCQNPIYLKCLELLFEREQVPQVVDIRHFRMELMESLEPANILRNQQVAGSIPAGGSITHSKYIAYGSARSRISALILSPVPKPRTKRPAVPKPMNERTQLKRQGLSQHFSQCLDTGREQSWKQPILIGTGPQVSIIQRFNAAHTVGDPPQTC